MSSNQYGFTCTVPWEGRTYDIQVVYKGTENDSEESRMWATSDWETEDPVALAAYELEHRDWTANPLTTVESRICVWACYGGWLPDDPSGDPTWNPPTPPEREVLRIIAAGQAHNIEQGWDT